MSRGPELGSIATWIVWARSWAEIPVLTPPAASIVTVKAVCSGASFLAAIRLRPSVSQRSAVSARQIRPRASLAMKLIASGVANCAAITRSPSFSRSSPSQTTTIRPRRISSIASSIVANGRLALAAAAWSVFASVIWLTPAPFQRMVPPAAPRTWRRRRTRRSACVPRRASPRFVRSRVSGISDTSTHPSPSAATVRLTPSSAIEPFLDHVAHQLGAEAHPQAPGEAVLLDRERPRRRRRRGPARCARRAGRRPSSPARG